MKNFYLSLRGGYASSIYLFFFIAVALSLLVSLIGPATRVSHVANQILGSRASYFISESGVEDVIYRLKSGRDVGSTETLSLGNASTTTQVTDTGTNGKEITSLGSFGLLQRRTQVSLETSDGVAFNYGIQAGQGGFVLANNAGVVGNVYSNGSIIGSPGAYITGSAFAANTSALSPDQSYMSPLPPSYDVVFGDSNGTQDVAQSFSVSVENPLNKVELYMKKTGSPANITVRVTDDSGGAPGSTLASATLSASLITTSYGVVSVTFGTNPILSPSTTYWLVLDASTGSSTKDYTIGAGNSYANGTGKIGKFGTSWGATTPSGLDYYFTLYTGGTYSTISDVTVGESGGDINAHTVTNSYAYGTLYCQSGSGNNKSCNTSLGDPAAQGLPISDAQIDSWKAEALDGGLYSGDYVIDGIPGSLGPIKIDGNLTITNGGSLTVAGTIWVTGSISYANDTIVSLSALYGADSGMILSDGVQSISNNTIFYGSGTPGSYIMILTTDDSSSAISVANNASTVIAYAPYGTVSFSNNADAKEAIAKTISLSNNAVITYETGLANVNFISGPSGSWGINSWKEIE